MSAIHRYHTKIHRIYGCLWADRFELSGIICSAQQTIKISKIPIFQRNLHAANQTLCRTIKWEDPNSTQESINLGGGRIEKLSITICMGYDISVNLCHDIDLVFTGGGNLK